MSCRRRWEKFPHLRKKKDEKREEVLSFKKEKEERKDANSGAGTDAVEADRISLRTAPWVKFVGKGREGYSRPPKERKKKRPK